MTARVSSPFAALLMACIAAAFAVPAGAQTGSVTFDKYVDRGSHRPAMPGPNGVVAAGHPLASVAGLQMLLAGGNAADAAVATLATLNVVRPQMSGMAGNGFFTIYEKVSGEVFNLAATGAAPMALDAAEVSDEDLSEGIKAGVVPGLFGGWIALLDRFGTMSLAQVLAPAIGYADNGHPLEASVAASIGNHEEIFRQYESSRSTFLPMGRLPEARETFRMPQLATTMRRVVEAEQEALASGATRSEALQAAFDRFYKGDIAREMADFYQENDGLFTYEDFARYEPIWREPVRTTYRGFDIYSSPPTSRGGLEVTMQLNLVEGFDLAARDRYDPETIHLLAEAIRVAKSDIYRYVADPLLQDVPVEAMLSKAYAAERRRLIDPSRTGPVPNAGDPTTIAAEAMREGPVPGHFREESVVGSTTSFSISDKWGNVIAATPTHGSLFGTGVVVGNTGMTFNNGTRIGSTSPYPEDVNYARGGQIPILNNSPTVVMKDGRFHAAVGTPGGETIGQTEFQVLVNLLDYGMDIQDAIEAPRFTLRAEPNFYRAGSEVTLSIEERVSEAVIEGLRSRGWAVQTADGYAFGSMQGLLVTEDGTIYGGADPRRMGYAVSY